MFFSSRRTLLLALYGRRELRGRFGVPPLWALLKTPFLRRVENLKEYQTVGDGARVLLLRG
jgi:hypothetical protein